MSSLQSRPTLTLTPSPPASSKTLLCWLPFTQLFSGCFSHKKYFSVLLALVSPSFPTQHPNLVEEESVYNSPHYVIFIFPPTVAHSSKTFALTALLKLFFLRSTKDPLVCSVRFSTLLLLRCCFSLKLFTVRLEHALCGSHLAVTISPPCTHWCAQGSVLSSLLSSLCSLVARPLRFQCSFLLYGQ